MKEGDYEGFHQPLMVRFFLLFGDHCACPPDDFVVVMWVATSQKSTDASQSWTSSRVCDARVWWWREWTRTHQGEVAHARSTPMCTVAHLYSPNGCATTTHMPLCCVVSTSHALLMASYPLCMLP